jgi:DNA modification methylase
MQLTKLKFNPENPRRISPEQLDKLVRSIESLPQMMELRPIVYDPATMHVLGGNQRLAALRKMGMKEIPDNWTKSTTDMTDKEKREFVLRDNVQAGEWDYSVLDESFADFDLEDLGVELPEGYDSEPAEVTEDDFVEPDKVETDIVLGDLFSLRKNGKEIHRLLCGDATKKEDVDRLMNGGGIDIVLTDPPYGVNIVGGGGKTGFVGGGGKTGFVGGGGIVAANRYSAIINDDSTDTAKKHYDLCVEMRAKNIVLFGGNYFTDFLPPSRHWIVWDKKGQDMENTFADCEMAWCSTDGNAEIVRLVWMGLLREGSRSVEGDKRCHPTQKPAMLMQKILKRIDGANVVDCFLGSGSTMVAAHLLDKICFGMELEPTYCQVSLDRMRKLDPDIEVIKEG